MTQYSTEIECHDGFHCLVVYTDDDGASGYGDNPKIGYWYGSREQCVAMAMTPYKVQLQGFTISDHPDSFDLACERRFD